jgi:hypothetical protein
MAKVEMMIYPSVDEFLSLSKRSRTAERLSSIHPHLPCIDYRLFPRLQARCRAVGGR